MSEQKQQSAIETELNKLGENISNLMKAMWDSEERKSVEREVSANLNQLNKKMDEAVNKVKTDGTAENIKKGVKDAWETAHGPQILAELETGLTQTLRKLNEELSKRAQPAQEVKPDEPVAEEVKPE
jgi:poly-D-alanine transfer protein DltD